MEKATSRARNKKEVCTHQKKPQKHKNTEEKLLRSLAELENQRSRFTREIKEALDFGGFNFAKESLSLLDNLQRAYTSIKNDPALKDNKDLDKFLKNIEIIEKEWDSIMDSQIKGTFLGCQVYGEYMLKEGKGNIINISSASAGPPLSKAFTYSAAKAAIKNLTQNLGREWGTKGVRVNAIRPGFFPTEWNLKNFIDEDRKKAILSHTPMKRFGTPNELTGAILWLASDASGFVTGAEITVDGGYSCMTI